MDLANRRILVTRPEPGASETARLILRHNGRALLAPVMMIESMEDSRPFQQAMERLASFDGVLITSANGARALSTALPEGIVPPPLFAVGGKSARLLQGRGWEVRMPEHPVGGEALGVWILEHAPEARRFLFLRAEEGREELIRLLDQAGKEVETISVYRSVAVACLPDEVLRLLPEVDAIPFFSPRTVAIFFDLLPGGPASLSPDTVIAALSPLTAEALRQRGVRVDLLAATHDDAGMIRALSARWTSL
ncbi:MAG: uroporphyrinogen-III synthase [Magnetococcales bacterium]|nr:uroporphyrinogen-III synthase [Magnetococcales bacterium]